MLCSKLLAFLVLATLLGRARSDSYLFDKVYYRYISKRIYGLAYPIYMDIETKLRHIQKYIDMHITTIDFQIGLIAAVTEPHDELYSLINCALNLELKNRFDARATPENVDEDLNNIFGAVRELGMRHFRKIQTDKIHKRDPGTDASSTGAVLKSFRVMLRDYRSMSALDQHTYWSTGRMRRDYFGQFFQMAQVKHVSNLLEIVTYKDRFDKAVAAYMAVQKKINAMKKACVREGRCVTEPPNRRSLDVESIVGQDAVDLESDYFGHLVPKSSKTKKNKLDEVEELLDTAEKSMLLEIPEVVSTTESEDNFTRINDWIRYLAKGGLENNRKAAEEEEEEFQREIEAALTETPSTIIPFSSTWPFTKKQGRTVKDIIFNRDIGDHYKMYDETKKVEKPLSPWSRPGTDDELKKKMRKQYYDKMRGNFDPKREGIDIDLDDMF